MSGEEEKSPFKVTDRRSFTAEGDLRPEAPQSESPRPEVTAPTSEPATPKSATEQPRPNQQQASKGSRPPMDFASFVLSLATTAMVHLGEVPDPAAGGRSRQNLEAARQMVDILGMLNEKTAGNLTPEEARLLDDILYELRMKILSQGGIASV